MQFKISKKAANDLESIWLYTPENWFIEQADRYFNLLMDEIEYLTEKPYSGKDYSRIKKGYFCSKVKSHVIFYKISKNADEIEIIRILHQRMDIEDRLND